MKYAITLTLIWLSVVLLAQDYGCATMEILAAQDQASFDAMNEQLYKYLQNKRSTKRDSIITLPVVVHVIHQNGAENISDAQIHQGIQHLNEAFTNEDSYDRGTGVDTKIRFCLAKIAPDGGYTSGITRTQSALTDLTFRKDDFALKRLIRWETKDYINIWLVQEITNLPCEPNVTGYANFPSSHGTSLDGIVCEARFFGSSPSNSVVHVHEMGHYLGLLHTFQGEDCKNHICLRDGDRVCDTPPDRLRTISGRACDDPPNSCRTDTYDGFEEDQRDLISNYMDYESTSCQHDFTQGQAARMHAAIDLSRSSLLLSDVCDVICSTPISAAFEQSPARIVINENAQFRAVEENGASYEWRLDGNLVSNNQIFEYNFPELGMYELELTVINAALGFACRSTQQEHILVNCTAAADFSVDTLNILPGDTLRFTNESLDANTFAWTLDGEKVAETADIAWVFEYPGTYEFGLQADAQSCTDEKIVLVQVGTIIPDVTITLEDESFVCGRDSISFRFEICNSGTAPIPAGVPVRFYDQSPFLVETANILSTFTTPTEIKHNCCEVFDYTTLASQYGHFYAVINDENEQLPFAFSDADFKFKYYEDRLANNSDDFNTFQLKPLNYAYFDTTVCYNGDTFQLNTLVEDTYYRWDNGDTLAYTTFSSSGSHWVDLTYCGFTRRHRYEVELRECSCKWQMPNVFTPNGDGVNDVFGLVYDCEYGITEFYMRIFNRWGQVVFESEQVEVPWSGNSLTADVYYYEVFFTESYEGKVESHQQKGKLSLLR